MRDPALDAHQQWLDLIQPVGLVASPPALLTAGAVLPANVIGPWRQLRELCGQADDKLAVADLAVFCVE